MGLQNLLVSTVYKRRRTRTSTSAICDDFPAVEQKLQLVAAKQEESTHTSSVEHSIPKWRVTRARRSIAREISFLEPKQELVEAKHEEIVSVKPEYLEDEKVANYPDGKHLDRPQGLTEAGIPSNSHDEQWSPPLWKEILEGIRKMRAEQWAPVDTMGCEKVEGFLIPKERRFAVLVKALLSSQTKDEITHAAVDRMQKKGLLSAEGLLKADESTISDAIYPVMLSSMSVLLKTGELDRNKTGTQLGKLQSNEDMLILDRNQW